MLDLDVADGLATITLKGAARGNALSAELVEQMLETLPRAWSDTAVHTVLLRGEGRHFCTGFDLGDLDRMSDGDLLLRFVRIEQLLQVVWHAPVRTAAVAAGRTWGAGADLFAACDVRIAAAETRFRFPGAGFGIVLGTRRLAARVGEDTARRWLLATAEVAAPEARDAGLVTDIVAADACAAWIADRLTPPRIVPRVVGALHAASRTDGRDADLAALVRSAALPGLRDRIAAYAAGARAGGSR